MLDSSIAGIPSEPSVLSQGDELEISIYICIYVYMYIYSINRTFSSSAGHV